MSNSEQEIAEKAARLDEVHPGWRDQKHSNGSPLWASDGTLLDERGNRSIFDDIDE
ncbi:MAG TPA: hypothetical protein VGV37_06145 [Aliidongia sp.]|uniref:hypothetical protein n=1 Tax=Aliidongia sp. TaxID=1914230 RepID=UPI002DDD264B|nr:hypothetical protein [Aliidongia sp.]HEV2674105.1 hypothetical protein [Aliidongia sp.]